MPAGPDPMKVHFKTVSYAPDAIMMTLVIVALIYGLLDPNGHEHAVLCGMGGADPGNGSYSARWNFSGNELPADLTSIPGRYLDRDSIHQKNGPHDRSIPTSCDSFWTGRDTGFFPFRPGRFPPLGGRDKHGHVGPYVRLLGV